MPFSCAHMCVRCSCAACALSWYLRLQVLLLLGSEAVPVLAGAKLHAFERGAVLTVPSLGVFALPLQEGSALQARL